MGVAHAARARLSRLVVGLALAAIGVAAHAAGASPEDEPECWCDGWASTNTHTPAVWWGPTVTGLGYRGARNTTIAGSDCVPWQEAWRRCEAGGKGSMWRFLVAADTPASFVLANLPADNTCRAVRDVDWDETTRGGWETGPWCFVEQADADSNGDVQVGRPWRNGTTSCDGLVRASCGVPQCAPAPACVGRGSAGEVLLANAGFERWEEPNVRWLADNEVPLPAWIETTVRHWEPCGYHLDVQGDATWGPGAGEVDGLPVPLAVEPNCDLILSSVPILPNSTARAGARSARVPVGGAARVPVEGRTGPRYTASVLKTSFGSMASLRHGARYRASVAVRCEDGADAVVSLGVTALAQPGSSAQAFTSDLPGWRDNRLGNEMPAVRPLETADGAPAVSTLRCDPGAPPTWRELAVELVPNRTARDTFLQLGFAWRDGAPVGAVLVDDAALERLDGDSDDTGCDGSEWTCRDNPMNLAYRLREEGGVAFGLEQYSGITSIGLDAAECRPPGADSFVDSECPFLADFPLPFLGANEVSKMLASLSDAELLSRMGWDAPEARAPGSDGLEAVRILRDGLPAAIDEGVFRSYGGPLYGSSNLLIEAMGLNREPLETLQWYVDASTTKGAWSHNGHGELDCTENADKRGALCYTLALASNFIGCQFPAAKRFGNLDASEVVKSTGAPRGTATFMLAASMINDQVHGALNTSHKIFVNGTVPCVNAITDFIQVVEEPDFPTDFGSEAPGKGCAGFQSSGMLSLAMVTWSEVINGLDASHTCLSDLLAIDFSAPDAVTEYNMPVVPSGGGGDGGDDSLVVPLAVSASAVLVVCMAAFVYGRYLRRETGNEVSSAGAETGGLKSLSVGSSTIEQGDLKLSRLIGQGAQAQVYEGTWKGSPVAVKSVHVYGETEEQAQANAKHALNELRVLTEARHPNVLYSYGVVVQAERADPAPRYVVNVVMELGECSLLDAMETPCFATLSVESRMEIAEGIAAGLHHLHTLPKPVCHRDMKPGNIIITRRGGASPTACLADFGVSVVNKADVTLDRMSLRGTLAYMAPELFRSAPDNQSVDGSWQRISLKAADVYSMARIFCEMLHKDAGVPNRPKMVSDVLVAATVDKQDLMESVPNDVVDLIKRCLSEDPLARPTAGEARDVFGAALADWREAAGEHQERPDFSRLLQGIRQASNPTTDRAGEEEWSGVSYSQVQYNDGVSGLSGRSDGETNASVLGLPADSSLGGGGGGDDSTEMYVLSVEQDPTLAQGADTNV